MLIRSLLISIPASLGWTAVLVTFSFAILPFATRTQQAALFRYWGRCMLWICRVRYRVTGLEHIADGQNYIFASNHMSLIDTPLLVSQIPHALCFLAKKELFSVPFMGWYLRRQGHIPIERSEPKATLRSMADAARVIEPERRSLLAFPEGTRSADGAMLPFKEGTAMLALRSRTPLLPMAVVGTERIMVAKSLEIRGGAVELRLGAPIPVEGLDVKSRTDLTERLRQAIEGLRA
ncbi:MAG: 1-acyl-sn-glycerol-3-phosphate acyltransferase [Bryobacteraceae bacterium]|nr:1-acyl-sn-glycerol-3-phosphate acyltransferase [Bryobacteraceae bacterium]